MKQLLYLFIGLVLVSSCDNELDIVAEGEETLVTYCLLNAEDSLHFVKVNRGFINQDIAPIVLAKDADELFFDSLIVRVRDKNINVTYDAEKLVWTKDSGVFSNAVNYIYQFKGFLTPEHNYELLIRNPLTGKEVTGNLKLVGTVTPTSPGTNTINNMKIVPGEQFPILYKAHRDAHEYEILLRFMYEEINQTTNEIKQDTITWLMARGKFPTFGEKRISIRTEGQVFYDYLASQLEQKPANIRRRGLRLQFEYWSADKELSIYSEVYGSSSIGVVQKTTDYTNINGGYGLFASRNNFQITGQILGGDIQGQLKNNPVMSPYNFSD